MKNYFYVLSAVVLAVFPLCSSAQTHIKDDFLENTSLDWTEFADKSGSGLVQNGYLELISKDKETPKKIWTDELPVVTDGDFTVKAEIVVPKLTAEICFGIIYNRNSDQKLEYYLFSSKECMLVKKEEVDPWPIKLPEGKNKTITVEIKQLGGKTIISVNDMQIAKFKNPIETPAFGFWTPGGSSLRVTSVEVDQDYNPSVE